MMILSTFNRSSPVGILCTRGKIAPDCSELHQVAPFSKRIEPQPSPTASSLSARSSQSPIRNTIAQIFIFLAKNWPPDVLLALSPFVYFVVHLGFPSSPPSEFICAHLWFEFPLSPSPFCGCGVSRARRIRVCRVIFQSPSGTSAVTYR